MKYYELVVWQKAIALTKEVYRLVGFLPQSELHALSNQMRRAAVSIPSNIAEGHSRNSTKEYINFLSIARGSKSELETQLIICNELNYISVDECRFAFQLLNEIGSMLYSLMKKLP
jgi:four helix bundle protein